MNIIIVMAHHCPVKIFDKKLSESMKRKKNMPNVMSITLLQIILFQSPVTAYEKH